MKNLFSIFGIHKTDEMERHIALKAQRNAYIFIIAALFVWSICESCMVWIYHTRLHLIPCMLLVTAVMVQTFSQLLMTRSAVKDDEDSYETSPLLRIIIFICVVAGIIATVVASIVIMSVNI